MPWSLFCGKSIRYGLQLFSTFCTDRLFFLVKFVNYLSLLCLFSLLEYYYFVSSLIMIKTIWLFVRNILLIINQFPPTFFTPSVGQIVSRIELHNFFFQQIVKIIWQNRFAKVNMLLLFANIHLELITLLVWLLIKVLYGMVRYFFNIYKFVDYKNIL